MKSIFPRTAAFQHSSVPSFALAILALAIPISAILPVTAAAQQSGSLLVSPLVMAQPPLQQEAQHHHASEAAQEDKQPEGPALRLEELEQMALTKNPTLRQADAQLRAAQGRKLQAGLYPNPTVGYQGEQIRGGSFHGGEQGAFVQQEVVLGGKLKSARNVAEQERQQAVAERDEQKLRILNAVRLAYSQAVAAQETVTLRTSLVKLAQDVVETSKQLFNVGQADQPDVLQAQVEEDQAELALNGAQLNQQRIWKTLAAVVGNPTLPFSRLEGNLEDIPSLDPQEWLQKLLGESPAARIAQLGVARAQAQLDRARREPIPNLQLRGGIEQNQERLEGTTRAVGLQGFAEAGVQIPIFNRNQGAIEAARADVERAQLETKRVELLLRERLGPIVQNYLMAKTTAERYRSQTLPRAENAYKLYLQKYNGMTAAYPQVLISQRTLFQLKIDYSAALEAVWSNSIALKGFMLTDGLEAPTSPSEIDRPVRETNLPVSSMGPQP
ncbi:MAG TPA: TolC family protein [Candidatus Angelobacter sp.]|nr:TolC family protein [Candidatus Angelobacter sp.]